MVEWRAGRTLSLTVESDKAMAKRADAYLTERFGEGLDSFAVPDAAFGEGAQNSRRCHAGCDQRGERAGRTMSDLTLNGIPVDRHLRGGVRCGRDRHRRHQRHRQVGDDRRDHDDRLRHLGDRLRRRGRHRCRAVAGGDSGRAPGRAHPAVRLRAERPQGAADQAGRPVHPHLPGHRLLRGRRRADQDQARRRDPLFRRRLRGGQAPARRLRQGAALLAHPGDGRRVPVRGHRSGPSTARSAAATCCSSAAPTPRR